MKNGHRKWLILGGREALPERIQRFQMLEQGVPTDTRMGRQIRPSTYHS